MSIDSCIYPKTHHHVIYNISSCLKDPPSGFRVSPPSSSGCEQPCIWFLLPQVSLYFYKGNHLILSSFVSSTFLLAKVFWDLSILLYISVVQSLLNRIPLSGQHLLFILLVYSLLNVPLSPFWNIANQDMSNYGYIFAWTLILLTCVNI